MKELIYINQLKLNSLNGEFKLLDPQLEIITKYFSSNKDIAISGSRQTGKTTILCIIAILDAMLNNKNVYIVSYKYNTSLHIIECIQKICDMSNIEYEKYQKGYIVFKNGAYITINNKINIDVYLFDECSYISDFTNILKNIGNVRKFAVSTSKVFSEFNNIVTHKLWDVYTLPSTIFKYRNLNWAYKMINIMGLSVFNKEYNSLNEFNNYGRK